MSEQRAYLSIVEWPGSLGARERVERLIAASGMDVERAELACRQATPMVAGMIDLDTRRHVLAALSKAGVLAIAPGREELSRVAQPLPARRLVEAMGSHGAMYMVEPWRGEARGLVASEIRLLVRATLRATSTTVTSDPNETSRSATRGYLVGGVAGMAAGAMAASGGSGAQRNTRIKMSEILDIYLRDGSRVRINGDKFSFDVLGGERSYTDRRNMDALVVRLAEASPRAIIDDAFTRFRPPGDVRVQSFRGSAQKAVRARDDAGAFDFYSPWVAMVYARLLRRSRPS